MNFFKKIYKYFALKNVNGLLAGPKKYEKKNKILRKCGFSIGKGTKIVGPIFVSANLIIGDNCFIGRNFSAEGNGTITIGDNVDIAPNVVISTGSHFIGDSRRRAGEGITKNIHIGTGTWLCNSCVVFDDVGHGCVVGAGSLVLHKTKNDVLLVGQPAVIKRVLE